MSEDAGGGEVRFVRVFFPGMNLWLKKFQRNVLTGVAREFADGFTASLTSEKKAAEIFVTPPAAMLENLRARLGAVELHEATYDEWIASGGEERGEKP